LNDEPPKRNGKKKTIKLSEKRRKNKLSWFFSMKKEKYFKFIRSMAIQVREREREREWEKVENKCQESAKIAQFQVTIIAKIAKQRKMEQLEDICEEKSQRFREKLRKELKETSRKFLIGIHANLRNEASEKI
jgi:hypothetical protein